MLNFMVRATVGLAVAASLACQPGRAARSDAGVRKLVVVSTVGMLDDAVRNVGGERVESIALMGPGVDPHLYRATAEDVGRLERADVVLYVGLELEGRMSDVLGKLGSRGKVVKAVGEAVPPGRLMQASGRPDPHIWFDVQLWSKALGAVAESLSKADPGSKGQYEANATKYRARLEKLDAYVLQRAAELSPERRVLVTAHDAFGYFGRRYGFKVLGIQGTSTAAEASAASMIQLGKVVAEQKVKAVFVESSVSPAAVHALRNAVQARGWSVQEAGPLFSDAMGAAGTPEGTYEGMVRHNIATIVEALK